MIDHKIGPSKVRMLRTNATSKDPFENPKSFERTNSIGRNSPVTKVITYKQLQNKIQVRIQMK